MALKQIVLAKAIVSVEEIMELMGIEDTMTTVTETKCLSGARTTCMNALQGSSILPNTRTCA